MFDLGIISLTLSITRTLCVHHLSYANITATEKLTGAGRSLVTARNKSYCPGHMPEVVLTLEIIVRGVYCYLSKAGE